MGSKKIKAELIAENGAIGTASRLSGKRQATVGGPKPTTNVKPGRREK